MEQLQKVSVLSSFTFDEQTSRTPRCMWFGHHISQEKNRSRVRRSHDPGKFGALQFSIFWVFLLSIVCHDHRHRRPPYVDDSLNSRSELPARGRQEVMR